MWALSLLLVLPLAALGQENPAQKDEDDQEPREMRTMQLPNGSTIRYEVLPGDDDIPPGELIVLHFDKLPPVNATQAAREEEPAPPAAQPRKERRDECRELRGKLLARLLELRGFNGVDPQFALWVERNLYLGGGNAPAFQFSADPLFLTALKTDGAAYGYATDLARCEGVQLP
jgi:hypothetical protein